MAEPDTRPLVSIGLPVYNGERYLSEALESLVAQTYPAVEIVISDNASTDRTGEICTAFADRDRRVSYSRVDRNRGASWNFNRVAALARGKYFMWAAHDDRWAPNCVAESVQALERFPQAVLCYHFAQPVDSRGEPVGAPLTSLANDHPDTRARWRRMLEQWSLHMAIYGVMRMDAVRRVREVQAATGADLAFVAELALLGPIIQIPEILSWKRFPDHGTAGRTTAEMLEYLGGRKVDRVLFPHARILVQCASGVERADLPRSTRLRWSLDAADVYFRHGHWLIDLKEAVLQTVAGSARSRE